MTLNLTEHIGDVVFSEPAHKMSNAAAFWTQRLHKHGHTGWADPVIYSYDQIERLALIEAAIEEGPITVGNALDFGCGVGDFSKLLLSKGFTVCGYDPFVGPRIRSERFSYARSYEEISIARHTADLALTVTTLDHILDDDTLQEALSLIRACLKEGGVLYMLEYALDSAGDREKFKLQNDYQSFRTLARWVELLTRNSLRILRVDPVPHPVISPSRGYDRYERASFVRFRRRHRRLPLGRLWFDPFLRWHASRLAREFPPVRNLRRATPLKLICCSTS